MKIDRNLVYALGAFLVATWLAAPRADAISIALVPSSVVVPVGASFGVDVVVSGLGDGAVPSLGSYDIDLSFDPALLAVGTVSFGVFLGAPDVSLVSVATSPGLVDFAEVSLAPPDLIDALQPGSFSVATVTFTSIAAGTSAIDFGAVLLGDAVGRELAVDTLRAAKVVSPIPEPAAAAVFAIAVAMVAWSERRYASR
jgi:hypothetical protein